MPFAGEVIKPTKVEVVRSVHRIIKQAEAACKGKNIEETRSYLITQAMNYCEERGIL